MPKVTITALTLALGLLATGKVSAQSSGMLSATATVIDMQPARNGLEAAQLAATDLTSTAPSQARRDISGAVVFAAPIADDRDARRRTAIVTLLYW